MVSNGIVNGYKIVPGITAIIQARMGSKRLPGKVMKSLGSRPMLEHIIERTQLIEGVKTVIVATCSGEENEPIIELAKEMDCEIFVGSEENVLERYFKAAEKFGGEYIIRITGDNPFVDVTYASMAVEIASESGADLSSISNLPLGTAVEVIKYEALAQAYEMSSTAYHFEHVTPYIKEHPEFFAIQRHPIKIDTPFKNLRLTVDTEEDFKLAEKIYADNYKGEPFSVNEIIEYLKENPELVKINSLIEQRGMDHSEIESEK